VFEPNSRYAAVEEATLEQDGRVVRYKRRRFVPEPGGSAVAEHTVVPGDRLDLLAARYLGDATQFWKLCDASGVLDPDELERPGATVHVRLEVPR
jgi:nucleoid-associated protein YgaU